MNRKLFLWAVAIGIFSGLLLLNIFPPAHPQEIELKEPYLCEYNEREGAYSGLMDETKEHIRAMVRLAILAKKEGTLSDDKEDKINELNHKYHMCGLRAERALSPLEFDEWDREHMQWAEALFFANGLAELWEALIKE